MRGVFLPSVVQHRGRQLQLEQLLPAAHHLKVSWFRRDASRCSRPARGVEDRDAIETADDVAGCNPAAAAGVFGLHLVDHRRHRR